MRGHLEAPEHWLATPGASRKITSPAPHLAKTGVKRGPYVDHSVDRFTGCPDISRRHRHRGYRGQKASSLNGIFINSDWDVGFNKRGINMLYLQTTEPLTQNVPTPEEIRQRAYEIHIERGGFYGCDMDDLLQAERELQQKYNNNEKRSKKT